MKHNNKSHHYNFQKDKKFHKKAMPIKEVEKLENTEIIADYDGFIKIKLPTDGSVFDLSSAFSSIPLNNVEGDNSKMSMQLPRFKNMEDMRFFLADSYITYSAASTHPGSNQNPQIFQLKVNV